MLVDAGLVLSKQPVAITAQQNTCSRTINEQKKWQNPRAGNMQDSNNRIVLLDHRLAWPPNPHNSSYANKSMPNITKMDRSAQLENVDICLFIIN